MKKTEYIEKKGGVTTLMKRVGFRVIMVLKSEFYVIVILIFKVYILQNII